jgi:hypothetical protein
MPANRDTAGRLIGKAKEPSDRVRPARSRGSRWIGWLTRIVLTAGVAASVLAVTASASSARDSSTNLFARVSAGGGLLAGNGVTAVTHLGSGRYEVTFSANVSGCAYIATIIKNPISNPSLDAVQVFTAGGHLSHDGVYVETKNVGSGLTDGPFNLVVDCGGPGWSFAVVGYDANLVRSSPGTTLTNYGLGRYDVTFNHNISSCAYLAQVGDPGNSMVVGPVRVYTGSASNPDAVYIETKNTGGGLTAGIPFHLAVICPTAASTTIAVVGTNGLIARGSSLTSSFSPTIGQYTVVTDTSASACATVATPGSADQSLPLVPTTVELIPGPAANTAGIQVTFLLGGALADVAFHAAIVC